MTENVMGIRSQQIPMRCSTTKNLIEEAPKTWEDVEKFCATFNGSGKYGMIFNVASGYYSVMFNGLNGNKLFGPDGTDATDTYMNNKDAVEGMKYFQFLP